MSAKHTPGPWQTMEVGDDIVRLAVADESGLSVLTVVTEGDAQFAAVYSEDDARLIAAAPDLLAALQAVLHDCENLDMVESNEPWRDIGPFEMAIAAIAKAIG